MLIFVLFLNFYSVSAVFAPADRTALRAAVQSCLSETTVETGDGSCPTFAASNDATGNPYGVMGDWDVSKVTSLERSTSTPPSCFCCCFFHLNSVHSLPLLFFLRFLDFIYFWNSDSLFLLLFSQFFTTVASNKHCAAVHGCL